MQKCMDITHYIFVFLTSRLEYGKSRCNKRLIIAIDVHIRIKVMVVFAKRQDYAHSIMLYRKLALKELINDFCIRIIRRIIRCIY